MDKYTEYLIESVDTPYKLLEEDATLTDEERVEIEEELESLELLRDDSISEIYGY